MVNGGIYFKLFRDLSCDDPYSGYGYNCYGVTIDSFTNQDVALLVVTDKFKYEFSYNYSIAIYVVFVVI